MGNRVYVVFCGYYSDWETIGYVESEKDAIEYCDALNCGGEKYHYKEADLLTGPVNTKIRRAWEVSNWNGEWEVSRCECEDRNKPEDTNYLVKEWFDDEIVLWLYPGEEVKAVKIAQDYLAEYKARKAGIT